MVDVKYIFSEIELLFKLQNERVVRYMKTWIDNNESYYIRMEFCSDNLKNILDTKRLVFNESIESTNELEFYILCKIFIELLKAVQYLHNMIPTIIHLDLKPANILFDEKGENGIFFKLCDFGLAKLCVGQTNTIGKGTQKYMASEVYRGHYDTKADVYSLGIIGLHDIFELPSDK